MEKNRLPVISIKDLILNKIIYLKKDQLYFLEDEITLSQKKTTLVYDEEDNLVFTIGSEIMENYFITIAKHRDDKINDILNG